MQSSLTGGFQGISGVGAYIRCSYSFAMEGNQSAKALPQLKLSHLLSHFRGETLLDG